MTTIQSPIGPITILATEHAITMIHIDSPLRAHSVEPTSVAREAAAQLRAYFERRLTRFDLPLDATGTPFQRRVWAALEQIPFGQTASYGQIAARIGSPTAARAVGMANKRNPIAIVVPCHRVIGASGALTGYAGGLDRKEFLLEHERASLFTNA